MGSALLSINTNRFYPDHTNIKYKAASGPSTGGQAATAMRHRVATKKMRVSEHRRRVLVPRVERLVTAALYTIGIPIEENKIRRNMADLPAFGGKYYIWNYFLIFAFCILIFDIRLRDFLVFYRSSEWLRY